MNKIKLAVLAVAALPALLRAEEPEMVPLLPAGVNHHVERALDALVMKTADARFDKDLGKPVWAHPALTAWFWCFVLATNAAGAALFRKVRPHLPDVL